MRATIFVFVVCVLDWKSPSLSRTRFAPLRKVFSVFALVRVGVPFLVADGALERASVFSY